MEFIELTGRTLLKVVDADEVDPAQLKAAGVKDDSLVRVNRQGDIELRKRDRWDIVGGLIGNYEQRLHQATGLDWA
jgi:hypothetical protein